MPVYPRKGPKKGEKGYRQHRALHHKGVKHEHGRGKKSKTHHGKRK